MENNNENNDLNKDITIIDKNLFYLSQLETKEKFYLHKDGLFYTCGDTLMGVIGGKPGSTRGLIFTSFSQVLHGTNHATMSEAILGLATQITDLINNFKDSDLTTFKNIITYDLNKGLLKLATTYEGKKLKTIKEANEKLIHSFNKLKEFATTKENKTEEIIEEDKTFIDIEIIENKPIEIISKDTMLSKNDENKLGKIMINGISFLSIFNQISEKINLVDYIVWFWSKEQTKKELRSDLKEWIKNITIGGQPLEIYVGKLTNIQLTTVKNLLVNKFYTFKK